jgi:hypothetical protein
MNGKPADTRTVKQVIAMHDLNHNGITEKFERTKECPCFDVIPEMRRLM